MRPAEDLFSVKNKVILITGGAGFLGLEYTAFLSRAGARVVVFDKENEEILRERGRSIKRNGVRRPEFFSVDITDAPSIQRAVKNISRRYGRIDVLVNNAAVTFSPSDKKAALQFSPYERYPYELWKRALDVSVTGSFLVTQAVIPIMKKQKSGVIINIGSIYGMGAPDNRIYGKKRFGSIAYATSKGALLNFTKALASYCAPFGVRANLLTLGGAVKAQDKKFVKKYSERTMLGRMAFRHEYNGALLFLASDASVYMTGANLVVDGGWSAW